MTKKEAIDEIRSWDFLNGKEVEAIQTLIPELRESDEIMRERAIAILKQQQNFWTYDGPMDKFPPAASKKDLAYAINVALSYLEKQKERKPAEWSEEDERMVRFYADDYDNNLGNMPMREVIENRIKFKNWILNRLKLLRPYPHWKPSEEQMEALKGEIKYCYACGMHYRGRELQSLCECLEKLR